MVCLEAGLGAGGGMYLLAFLIVWSGTGEVNAACTKGFLIWKIDFCLEIIFQVNTGLSQLVFPF